jgi:sulfoxide reductase heme-binding subunit YedZ
LPQDEPLRRHIQVARKLIVFALCLWPAITFAIDYVGGDLARPWRMIINGSGEWSMRFLILSLCLSPLAVLTRIDSLGSFRRMIGLFGAFYAALHLFAWTRQYGFDWPFLTDEVVLRPYLTIGFISIVLLAPLAVTSPGFAHALLGLRRWQRLHMLMYPMVLTAFIHYAMARSILQFEVAADLIFLVAAFLWRVARRSAASV